MRAQTLIASDDASTGGMISTSKSLRTYGIGAATPAHHAAAYVRLETRISEEWPKEVK